MTRRQISETLRMEGLQLIHIAVPLGHNQADCHPQDPLMVVPPFSIFDHMLTYYCYIFYHATHLLSTLHLVLKSRSGSFVSPRPVEFSASKNIQLLWTPLINCNRLCISPLIPPFNKPYSELGRAGLHTFPLPNNAVYGRLTSISCLSPLPNKLLVFFLQTCLSKESWNVIDHQQGFDNQNVVS